MSLFSVYRDGTIDLSPLWVCVVGPSASCGRSFCFVRSGPSALCRRPSGFVRRNNLRKIGGTTAHGVLHLSRRKVAAPQDLVGIMT